MVQLREKLKISAEEFMYVVRNSVFEEAKACGMESTSIADVIEGYTYYKTLKTAGGSDVRVKTTVNCYIAKTQYSATVKTGDGEYAVTYIVRDVEDGVEVEYTEGDSYQKTLRKLNAGLMGIIFGRGQKKKIRKMLKAMESYIQTDRAKLAPKIEKMAELDSEKK